MEILKKYPSLYQEKDLPMTALDFKNGKPLWRVDMDKSCMHWGLDVPEDWLPVIDKLSYVLTNPYRVGLGGGKIIKPKFIAKQVKIKFGELRFYYEVDIEVEGEELTKEERAIEVRLAGKYADGAIAMASAMCEGEPY
jgi:hypothetical protein